ncbi:MAG: hypothetical protein DCC55_35775, partial [Chloroflexi bacterium]
SVNEIWLSTWLSPNALERLLTVNIIWLAPLICQETKEPRNIVPWLRTFAWLTCGLIFPAGANKKPRNRVRSVAEKCNQKEITTVPGGALALVIGI